MGRNAGLALMSGHSLNMLTQEQFRNMIDAGLIPPNPQNTVKQGVVSAVDGTLKEYVIVRGWDAVTAHRCDKLWDQFNLEVMEHIHTKVAPAEQEAAAAQLQLEDEHWDWLTKTMCYRTPGYEWFFLIADNKPQGACLIYHPHKSAFSGEDIFYIEYVAVAPWNRQNPMQERVFSGIGPMLIKAAVEYAVTALRLKHGFCLHALAQAVPFYQKIGMLAQPGLDKPNLQYFEMPEADAAEYMVKP